MRWHRGNDGWGRDSYGIRANAVVGVSDCGMSSDSPARSDVVKAELDDFRQVLRQAGIKSRLKYNPQPHGNGFVIKRWVIVRRADFAKAAAIALDYCAAGNGRLIHDADLPRPLAIAA